MIPVFDAPKRPLRRWLAAAIPLLFFALACATPATAQESAGSVAPAPERVAPVVLDGETLFRVRGVSAYPAERRAAEIRARIVELARDETFDIAALGVEEGDEGSRIKAGETILFRVYDVDAELEGIARPLLAAVLVSKTREAVTEYREVRDFGHLLRNGLVALGATAVFLALFWATRRVFRWLLRRVALRMRRGVRELASKSRDLLDAGQM